MYDYDFIRTCDTKTIEWLKEQMMKAYQTAVNFLDSEDQEHSREYAQYFEGMGKAFKMVLEEKYDFRPEQEIDELDDLLYRLEEELY